MSLIFTQEERAAYKKKAGEVAGEREAMFLSTAQQATINFYRGLPKRYKMGWLKSHLGVANKKQAIAAFCYSCVKYKNVQKTVGGCTISMCPMHQYRPLQKKEK
jgi:hypothetical protein